MENTYSFAKPFSQSRASIADRPAFVISSTVAAPAKAAAAV